MKGIRGIAQDVRDVVGLLTEVADRLDALASIDLSGIAALLGERESAAGVQPSVARPKEHTDSATPSRAKSRKFSATEKAQARLLWEQSPTKDKARVRELALQFQTTTVHMARLVYPNNSAVEWRTRRAADSLTQPSA